MSHKSIETAQDGIGQSETLSLVPQKFHVHCGLHASGHAAYLAAATGIAVRHVVWRAFLALRSSIAQEGGVRHDIPGASTMLLFALKGIICRSKRQS